MRPIAANSLFDETTTVAQQWTQVLTPKVWLAALLLLSCSAFFSASEVAFYSLHTVRLLSMRQSKHFLDRLVAQLMSNPNGLLTSILMGNCIVNILLGVIFAARVEIVFDRHLTLPPALSYPLAVFLCTAMLVFFGEITPKLVAVQQGERFARWAAIPIFLLNQLLAPVREILIWLIGLLFRLTRFSEVPPAPFMTEDEFKSLLTEGEATGVIEEEERQMIQGILDVREVRVREILTPRPDMIVLSKETTIGDALAVVREHEYARIPVYEDDLDHITGLLFAKDLLPAACSGELDAPITPLLRKPHFVPETMEVSDFLRMAQRVRTHLSIVVDEYGGTEGLVTLQDALREVVGDIGEEDDEEEPLYTQLDDGVFRVDGSLPLDELEELTGTAVEDEEHTTVAGFIMDRTDKIPEVGDEVEYDGVYYVIEAVEGKRVAQLRLQVPPRQKEDDYS